MTPSTKTLLEVLVTSARGVLAALTRAVAACEKWIREQPVDPARP